MNIPGVAAEHIRDDVWLVPHLLPAGPEAFIPVNSMVIRGDEPVLVDTGAPVHRDTWLETAFALVDPDDVRWVFLSHDDADHVGNLEQVLAACPRATVVTNFFMCERMAAADPLPLSRLRWLNPGESLNIGDRTLHALVPPLFDSPTTRGVFDDRSGVLWAADSFACPVPGPVWEQRDLPAGMWEERFFQFNSFGAPWHAWLDSTAYNRHVRSVQALPLAAVASAHGPILRGVAIDDAFDRVRAMAGTPVVTSPGQALLDDLLAAASLAPAVPALTV